MAGVVTQSFHDDSQRPACQINSRLDRVRTEIVVPQNHASRFNEADRGQAVKINGGGAAIAADVHQIEGRIGQALKDGGRIAFDDCYPTGLAAGVAILLKGGECGSGVVRMCLVATDRLPGIGASQARLRMTHQMVKKPSGILTVRGSDFEDMHWLARAGPWNQSRNPVLLMRGNSSHWLLLGFHGFGSFEAVRLLRKKTIQGIVLSQNILHHQPGVFGLECLPVQFVVAGKIDDLFVVSCLSFQIFLGYLVAGSEQLHFIEWNVKMAANVSKGAGQPGL